MWTYGPFTPIICNSERRGTLFITMMWCQTPLKDLKRTLVTGKYLQRAALQSLRLNVYSLVRYHRGFASPLALHTHEYKLRRRSLRRQLCDLRKTDTHDLERIAPGIRRIEAFHSIPNRIRRLANPPPTRLNDPLNKLIRILNREANMKPPRTMILERIRICIVARR